jgi:thioredoxin-like negative regulator of GroEL
MDFLQPALDRLRVSALEISALTPSMDSAALCAALNSLGHEEKVETLLHSKNATLPANARAKIEQHLRAAANAWEQTYGAYTMKKQEHEMQDALRLLERDPSQANLDRLYALQKQIDVMRQNHYRSTSDEQAF